MDASTVSIKKPRRTSSGSKEPRSSKGRCERTAAFNIQRVMGLRGFYEGMHYTEYLLSDMEGRQRKVTCLGAVPGSTPSGAAYSRWDGLPVRLPIVLAER